MAYRDTLATRRPAPLFADLRLDRGILTARVVGPSLARREGVIITRMIRTALSGTDEPVRRVVLDLSDVAYLNSAGLSAFVAIHHAAQSRGATVRLHNLRAEIKEVLRMVGLDRLFITTTGGLPACCGV